jgi:cellobiose-specific phosphotransferase system component IIB
MTVTRLRKAYVDKILVVTFVEKVWNVLGSINLPCDIIDKAEYTDLEKSKYHIVALKLIISMIDGSYA